MVKTASDEAGNGQTVNVTQQRSRKVLVKTKDSGSSLVAQQSGDPELSLLWLGVLSWCGFNPWLGNFYMPQVQLEKKKKKDSDQRFQDIWRFLSGCQQRLLSTYQVWSFVLPVRELDFELYQVLVRPRT